MRDRIFDLVVPTYNRGGRLPRLCANVMSCPLPPGWRRRVYLVDNASTDATAATARGLAAQYGEGLSYVHEPRQGSSAARNAGIRSGSGELVGFIDDDETLRPDWFGKAIAAFEADPQLSFISGACIPDYEAPPPAWLPIRAYPAVIGSVFPSDRRETYGEWDGEIMAGNLVIRRPVLEEVGLFNERLGRVGSGTGTGEDRDLHFRLLAAGKKGEYRPDLIIDHAVLRGRMTRGYFVRWAFSNGRSTGRLDRSRTGSAKLLGVPRWRWRQAAEGLGRYLTGGVRGAAPAERFAGLLDAVALGGSLYGLVRGK